MPVTTRDLWRAAEAGDIDQIERILSRGADVNARGQHGTTALMLAACQGHERVVRALLDHGASPNLARNDGFTALALAAFFGHTATVKRLIEHGAAPELVTRCGTSAYMWAKARTFEEAARYLKSHAPVERKELIEVAESFESPKRLTDPPEIWDLVHEVPRKFKPGAAFVSRLESMRASFVMRIAVVLLVSLACVVGVMILTGSEARNLEHEPNQAAVGDSAEVSEKDEPSRIVTSAAPIDVEETPAEALKNHHGTQVSEDVKQTNGRGKLYQLTRQSRSRPVRSDAPVEIIQGAEEVAEPKLTVATPRFESRSSAEPSSQSKASAVPSPQSIAPTKRSPPKGKVIQWP